MFVIVGGDSEIGAAAYRNLKARGEPAVATTRRRDRMMADRPFLDLAIALGSWVPPPATEAVCICAAVPRIAACAADPAGTSYINVDQTLALVDKLVARGIYVLFLSTNQVFDGRTPNVSADAPLSPMSEYGRQKARTESALRLHLANGAPVGILRLAKVVSASMPLIENWIADLSVGKPIRAFGDMKLAPAPTELVSDAIAALLKDRPGGIFQLTGPRDVSYADVGRFVAGRLGADASLVTEGSASSAGLPEGATPDNTTLDSSLLRSRYGYAVPDVWQVVGGVIAALDLRR